MDADDLALIASSPDELQSMLNIVTSYASKWRYVYQLNSSKSVVMVFGEAAQTRSRAGIDVMSGVEWVNGRVTQVFIVDYLEQLRCSRNELILSL